VLCDDKRVDASGGGRQWRDMVRTIESLSPKKLTALDGKGAVIRAVDLDASDDDDDEKPRAVGGGVNSDNEVIVFASLIEKAYEKAATANQPLIENAMSFVERLSNRLTKAETEIERLRNHNNRLIQQINELQLQPVADSDGEGGLILALAQGMVHKQSEVAAKSVKKG
jgi:hypothetical protein